MEIIPPTQNALILHKQWAINLDTPSPEGHGWTFDNTSNSWIPVWTTIPVASKACSELLKCGCKKEIGARCACKKANWKCAAATVTNS